MFPPGRQRFIPGRTFGFVADSSASASTFGVRVVGRSCPVGGLAAERAVLLSAATRSGAGHDRDCRDVQDWPSRARARPDLERDRAPRFSVVTRPEDAHAASRAHSLNGVLGQRMLCAARVNPSAVRYVHRRAEPPRPARTPGTRARNLAGGGRKTWSPPSGRAIIDPAVRTAAARPGPRRP